MAWPVKEEKDNAEADRQMWALKQLAVQVGCILMVLWNMGEGNVKEKLKARQYSRYPSVCLSSGVHSTTSRCISLAGLSLAV